MLPDETIAERKAALLVHALPMAARGTVLGRLTPIERERLKGLLDELSALGIPAQQDWLSQVQADVPRAGDPDVRCLEAACVLDVARALADQPADVVAAVVSARSWPWRDAVIDQMPSAQRIRVHAALAGAVRPSLATQAVLLSRCAQAVRDGMSRLEPGLGQPTRAGVVPGRLPWLRRIFRSLSV